MLNYNFYEIDISHTGLIDYVIGEVTDRVLVYLNSDTLPEKLERVLASIVNTSLIRCLNTLEATKDGIPESNRAVTAISDNGQTISYANEIARYFTAASDEELFVGFTSLLNRYRRVKVVYPKSNENGNIQSIL